MYVIVLKSEITEEIFAVERNMSEQPCRYQDYASAERAAYEKNLSLRDFELKWVSKQDDGIYHRIDHED